MRSISTLILILSLFLLSACDRHTGSNELTVFNGFTMGTTYNIKLNSPKAKIDINSIRQKIEDIFDEINQIMSTYSYDSEISEINRTKNTNKISISRELSSLLSRAIGISRFTNGAFDITVGPLVNLWGFGPDEKLYVLPSKNAINNTLEQTGFEKITLGQEPFFIKKLHPDMYLDLSAIAKGHSVDAIADYLDTLAIENYMIEVGGEIKAKGVNANGLIWRIGIERPVTDERLVQRIIQLDNMSMATSGDYRNYFEIDDKLYSHTIDPKTGYPVSHDLISVTVLGKSCARADALATALLVMGPAAGFEFAEENKLTAMFISKSKDGFKEEYTASFLSYLIE